MDKGKFHQKKEREGESERLSERKSKLHLPLLSTYITRNVLEEQDTFTLHHLKNFYIC